MGDVYEIEEWRKLLATRVEVQPLMRCLTAAPNPLMGELLRMTDAQFEAFCKFVKYLREVPAP